MRNPNSIDRLSEALTNLLEAELSERSLPDDLPGRIRATIERCLSRDTRACLTPPELAVEWGVSPDKILTWIRSGELRATNIAVTQGGRPRYRIDREAIDDFKRRRANHSPPPPQRRRQTSSADVIEFF
ncbi:MAG: helix-turn-helix domain-containing protein [Planctomycetaceae bacterium]